MTIKLETSVRRGDVSKILPLIAKLSHETWNKLSSNARTSVAVEDLMAMGTSHLVTYVVKMYKSNTCSAKRKFRKNDPYSNAQFITYAHVALQNLYKDVLAEHNADRRVARVLSGDQPVLAAGKERILFDVIASVNKYSLEQTMLERHDAERAFLAVYAQASTHLRKHLIGWCIQPAATKYKLTNSKFIKARREFKEQHLDKILTQELVATIQNDAIARSRVTLAILRNENFRTIRRGCILERELLPAVIDEEAYEFFDISLQ